jgi:hypothetical protein
MHSIRYGISYWWYGLVMGGRDIHYCRGRVRSRKISDMLSEQGLRPFPPSLITRN